MSSKSLLNDDMMDTDEGQRDSIEWLRSDFDAQPVANLDFLMETGNKDVAAAAPAEAVVNTGGQVESKLPTTPGLPTTAPTFRQSRERTRVSAVQRLVERKLAQKERSD